MRRLGARRVATAEVPVLFEANVAGSLVGHFVSAASGSSLYRRSSFLLEAAGKSVFSPIVNLDEEPHLPGGMASGWFDGEGVATRRAARARCGRPHGLLPVHATRPASSASRRRATRAAATTSSCSRAREDFAGLVRAMGRGLVVTELMGQGVNPVTGDYSRGAVGFWVEAGEIRYPVEEVTIAGNLPEMYRGIVADRARRARAGLPRRPAPSSSIA